MRRQISSKSESCSEAVGVYVAGISVKVGAHYPGRSGVVPCASGAERLRDATPEVSRGHSKAGWPSPRPEHETRSNGLDSHECDRCRRPV